jgi:hypothetical protein
VLPPSFFSHLGGRILFGGHTHGVSVVAAAPAPAATTAPTFPGRSQTLAGTLSATARRVPGALDLDAQPSVESARTPHHTTLAPTKQEILAARVSGGLT